MAERTSLYLKQLEVGPMDNFCYLIGDKKKGECVLVDPAWDVGGTLETARKDGMRVVGALITHTHFDHSNGAEDFVRETGAKIYVHKTEAEFLKAVQNYLVRTQDGFSLEIGAIRIEFLHTPGHTPGGQCFLVTEKNDEKPVYLFSGDTLFVHACGRCDLPGSDPEAMYASLQRLAQLGDPVILLPGHHYGDTPTSTIGEERRSNPYYQCRSLDDFLGSRMHG